MWNAPLYCVYSSETSVKSHITVKILLFNKRHWLLFDSIWFSAISFIGFFFFFFFLDEIFRVLSVTFFQIWFDVKAIWLLYLLDVYVYENVLADYCSNFCSCLLMLSVLTACYKEILIWLTVHSETFALHSFANISTNWETSCCMWGQFYLRSWRGRVIIPDRSTHILFLVFPLPFLGSRHFRGVLKFYRPRVSIPPSPSHISFWGVFFFCENICQKLLVHFNATRSRMTLKDWFDLENRWHGSLEMMSFK